MKTTYYNYNEENENEFFTLEQIKSYFNNDENLQEQKKYGTTFQSWLEEMLHMQIYTIVEVNENLLSFEDYDDLMLNFDMIDNEDNHDKKIYICGNDNYDFQKFNDDLIINEVYLNSNSIIIEEIQEYSYISFLIELEKLKLSL